jgi:GT2 family glycosyltransferase
VEPIKIAILATCFNRKHSTLACLRLLEGQQLAANVTLKIYLTDDNSSDGTRQAVATEFPRAHILSGDGSLFWAGGMRKAWAEAMKHRHNFYLWINDDTLLYPTAIQTLLETHAKLLPAHGDTIIVGAVQDEKTKRLTYSGITRTDPLRPLRFSRVLPGDEPIRCDTMNGNCVLIPAAITERVGNISDAFTHSMGDYDYGLRATRSGYSVWVAPGYVGTCSNNPVTGTWRDSSLSPKERWAKLVHIKGLPPREWQVFAQRHAGRLWPLYWASPYVRVLLQALRPRWPTA